MYKKNRKVCLAFVHFQNLFSCLNIIFYSNDEAPQVLVSCIKHNFDLFHLAFSIVSTP